MTVSNLSPFIKRDLTLLIFYDSPINILAPTSIPINSLLTKRSALEVPLSVWVEKGKPGVRYFTQCARLFSPYHVKAPVIVRYRIITVKGIFWALVVYKLMDVKL